MNRQVKDAVSFIIPVIAIIVIFQFSKPLGFAAIILFLAYLVYRWRSLYFAYKGNLQYSLGNLDEAVKWFERAYRSGNISPGQITAYGFILLKKGDVEKSDQVLSQLLSAKLSKTEEMNAKSNYALVLWKRGKREEAIKLLTEVYNNYKNTIVYGSLGYFLILQGDLEKALAFNQEAYEFNNTDKVILDNLAYNYYRLKRFDEAAQIYEKLHELSPSFSEAYYYYGLVLWELNKREKALEMAEKALDHKLSIFSTISKEQIKEKISEMENEINYEKNNP